jgi:hypothetical protein
MARKLENYVPIVKMDGIVTDKNVTIGGTLSVTGATSITGAVTQTGTPVMPNPVLNQTVTVIDAQNATLTIAQVLGGIITHNSKTGGGQVDLPTGALMSGGVSGVAVGSTINWIYYNYGNQTATITAANAHTIVGGTAAVTTGKHVLAQSYCASAGTWVTFLTTLF